MSPLDRLDALLEEQLVGLTPPARAVKMEKIALAVARKYEELGDGDMVRFWRERADEASAEAIRLARWVPTPRGLPS